MKKFLQKSLFRLHSLLLLLVMSVVGVGSAWADGSVTINLCQYGFNGITEGQITATYPKWDYAGAELYGTNTLTLEGDGVAITKVEFYNLTPWETSSISMKEDGGLGVFEAEPIDLTSGSSCVWTSSNAGGAASVLFSARSTSGDDFYIESIKVYYVSLPDIEYHVNITSVDPLPVDFTPTVTLDGENFQTNGTHTISKALNEKHITATVPNEDWYYDVVYNENNEHTFTVTYKEYNHYIVNVTGCEESNAGVRYHDITYYNNDKINVKNVIDANDLSVVHVNGYVEETLEVSALTGHNATINVPYTEHDFISYTVTISGMPSGASVMLESEEFSTDGTFTHLSRKDLSSNDASVQNCPATHYTNDSYQWYNSENKTFSITFTPFIVYTVAVDANSAYTADEAGVKVKYGNTYHVGDPIYVKNDLTIENVEAAEVDGYTGTVTLADNVFTVSYTKNDFVLFKAYDYDPYWSNSPVDDTKEGVNLNAQAYGEYFFVNNRSNNHISLTSSVAPIVKVVLEYYTWAKPSGGYYEVDSQNQDAGSISTTDDITTWTGSANSLELWQSNGNTAQVSLIKVYLAQPTTYTIAVVGAPAESNVSVSVDGIAGTYEDGGSFDTTDEIEAGDVTATLVDGYKAKVSIADNGEGKTITVTYVKVGAQIEFDFAQINKNSETIDDVTFTTNGYENGVVYLGLENNITFTSEDAKILIVEFEGERVSLIGSDPSGISNGVWEGASNSVVFTPTVPFNGPRLTKATVTLEALGDPTHYTVVFVPANDGASVTIDNNVLTPANSTFDSYKTLDETKVGNVVAPEGYYYDDDVAYNSENHTFTVTYTAYTKYSVAVAGDYTGDEAGVVVSGATYGNGTYSVGTDVISSKGDLEESKFTAKSVDGYDGAVSLNGYTVTVTYTAWPTWTVNITAPADYTGDALTATVKGTPYANGDTFKSKETVTDAQVSATSIPNYDASIVIDDNQHTITVTYVAYPTVAISNTDSEGKYWATFSFNHPVSFDAGVTPYIVTGAEDNKLTLEEIEILPAKKIKSFDFSNRKVDDILDNGRMFIEDYSGTNYYVNISYTGGTIAYNCFSGASTLNITSITLPIHQMIVTPGANGAKCSLNGGAAVEVSSEPYTFEVNAQSCTLAISGIGETTPQIACIDFIYAPTPVIPANTGVLLKAENAIANVNYSAHANADVNVDVTGNKLEASGNGVTMTEADPANLYYMLSLNAASDAGSLAFYWGTDSEQGHKISMPANKAYLKLPVSAGSSNRMLISGGYDETPTAIDGVVEVSDDAPIFTLQGKRVSRENLPAGVYVKNGRKFIVK